MSQHADSTTSSHDEAHGNHPILYHTDIAAPHIRAFCGSPSASNVRMFPMGFDVDILSFKKLDHCGRCLGSGIPV